MLNRLLQAHKKCFNIYNNKIKCFKKEIINNKAQIRLMIQIMEIIRINNQ